MAAETHAAQAVPPTSDPADDTVNADINANANGSSSAAAKQLKRACDCCRKRKVKCDGQDPCTPCKKASIRCAYLAVPKKKGPKGLRSARVLHALRKIDDAATSPSLSSPLSPQGPFGNWGWSQDGNGHQGAAQYHGQPHPQANGIMYGQQTSVAPDQQSYYPAAANTLPTHQHQQPGPPAAYRSHPPQPPQRSWTTSTQAESITGSEGAPPAFSPTSTDVYNHRMIPPSTFLPYVRLFFNHMFAIMPVLDRSTFLDPTMYSNDRHMSSEMHAFISALCAATIVQLDDSIPQPSHPLHGSKKPDALFAEECLRERKTFDIAEQQTTLSIMTSFFLFAYYGNCERHDQAWFYLQESITVAENLNMDDEESYDILAPVESQWRRRLYWLLFITERAYAVQRRKHTRLHASVTLPAPFPNEEPQLLNGFVNLANLFSAVDESFVNAWRGSRRASLCDEAWLVKTQKQLDETANAAGMGELTETQHLDISITREWLHVLAWQMGVSNGLIWGQGEGGMRLDYPVELARKVVDITSGASQEALDSHGIGMEQKLSDIAGCLADVLKCTAGDGSPTFLEGKQYLNILLHRLSSMRGKQSRYLQPLVSKMDGLLGYGLSQQNLPLPDEPIHKYESNGSGVQMPTVFAPTSPKWTMRESVSMLRTLSMCGTLGMPGISVPAEDWGQRRPSGRILENEELDLLQPWLQQTVAESM